MERAWGLVFVLLAGCLDPTTLPVTPEQAADSGPCLLQTPPQFATQVVNSRHIRIPDGHMASGVYAEFRWSRSVSHLTHLNVTMEWNATTPLGETLRMGISNPEATSYAEHYAHGPYDGRSPLRADIAEPRTDLFGQTMVLHLEADPAMTPAGGVVRGQPVTITVQETYAC